MAIKKGFELCISNKRYVEINGDLWIFPHPRPARRHPGQDRLEGACMIPGSQVDQLLEALKLSRGE